MLTVSYYAFLYKHQASFGLILPQQGRILILIPPNWQMTFAASTMKSITFDLSKSTLALNVTTDLDTVFTKFLHGDNSFRPKEIQMHWAKPCEPRVDLCLQMKPFVKATVYVKKLQNIPHQSENIAMVEWFMLHGCLVLLASCPNRRRPWMDSFKK